MLSRSSVLTNSSSASFDLWYRIAKNALCSVVFGPEFARMFRAMWTQQWKMDTPSPNTSRMAFRCPKCLSHMNVAIVGNEFLTKSKKRLNVIVVLFLITPHASVWTTEDASRHNTQTRGSENTFAHEVSSRYTKSTGKCFDARTAFAKKASTNMLSSVKWMTDSQMVEVDAALRSSRHCSDPRAVLTELRTFWKTSPLQTAPTSIFISGVLTLRFAISRIVSRTDSGNVERGMR